MQGVYTQSPLWCSFQCSMQSDFTTFRSDTQLQPQINWWSKQKHSEIRLDLVLHQTGCHTQSPPAAGCFVLTLTATVSLSLSLHHAHGQQHISTKRWQQTVGDTLVLPAYRAVRAFRFSSRVRRCQHSSAECHLASTPYPQPAHGDWNQTPLAKLTDSTDGTNMRRALIKDSNSALRGSDTSTE